MNRKQLVGHYADLAKAVVQKAQDANREMTQAERDEVETYLARGNEIKSNIRGDSPSADDERENARMRQRVERLGVGAGPQSAKASSWIEDPLTAVSLIPRDAVFGRKALIDDPDEANVSRAAGILGEPSDGRYLYPNLPTSDPQGATSVEALVSEGRVLDADVKDLTSTDEKAVTSSGATLKTFRMQRVATVSDFYPNAIVDQEAFRQLVDGDMRTAIRQNLDEYVIGELIAGAGFDSAAGSDLIERIRKAQTAIQDEGLNPNLVAISADDAEALDLTRTLDGEGPFLLDPSPRQNGATPLFGMRVVIGAGVTAPIVLDTSAVQTWLGSVAFAADPYTQFRTNQSRFRLEAPCLAVVRQPSGVYVIGSGS